MTNIRSGSKKVKRPSFQFYPNDWYSDFKLRSIGLAARGMWIDVLCIMHQSDDYGYLPRPLAPNPIRIPIPKDEALIDHVAMISDLIDANPGFCERLSRMVSSSEKEARENLIALAGAHVFSFSRDGRAYSKRMVADEGLRNIRAEAGKLGGVAKAATDGKVRRTAPAVSGIPPVRITPSYRAPVRQSSEQSEQTGSADTAPVDGAIVGDRAIAFYTLRGDGPVQRIEVTVTEGGMERLSGEFPGLDITSIVRGMEFYWNKSAGIKKRPKKVYAAIANACRRKAKDMFVEQYASADRVMDEKAKDLAARFNAAAKGLLPEVSMPLSISRESLLLSAYKMHPDDAYWDDVFLAIKTNTMPPNCGFDWLFKAQANWTKVKERTYELRTKTPAIAKVNANPAIGNGTTVAKKLAGGGN